MSLLHCPYPDNTARSCFGEMVSSIIKYKDAMIKDRAEGSGSVDSLLPRLRDRHLLMGGIGSRLVVVLFVVVVLWCGFYWAVSTPGAL